MRSLSERSPQPPTSRTAAPKPVIVEPSDLRPRSNPPGKLENDPTSEPGLLPSLPPDAIVPGTASGEDAGPIRIPSLAPGLPELTLVEAEPAAPPEPAIEEGTPQPSAAAERASEEALSMPSLPAAAGTGSEQAPAPFPPLFEVTGDEPTRPPPAKRFPWGMVIATVVLTVVSAVVTRLASTPRPEAPRATVAVPAPVASAAPEPSSRGANGAAAPPSSSSDDVPAGAEVPAGYGLIVVTAPAGARVRLDGALLGGAGPIASAVAAPGYHDVRVEQDQQKEVVQAVEVRAGKVVRAGSAASP
jgi:hypothetical protein